MKKVLGWIFNRFVLGAVLLLALAFIIWFIGPIIAIGEARPLDSERARWITIGVLVLLFVIWATLSVLRKRRGNNQVVDQLIAQPATPGAPAAQESADLVAVRQRFEQALGTLRKARFGGGKGGLAARFGGKYLYELPWYMIIGAPGSGKTTALRNSGLQFPLADAVGDHAVRGVGGTRNCDWWFTDQAVLIDTAGRFTTQDSDQATDSATWSGFLGMLKRSRPRQPLNGVLVTVSVADLIAKSGAERARHAATVRQRVQELHEKLNIRFPIYLLVTKCDLLAGFMEMFGSIDKAQRAEPWGFTFALDKTGLPKQPPTSELGPEFDQLLQRLSDGLIDRLQSEPDPQRRSRIYGFPGQFANLRGVLQEFVESVFSPSPYEAQPLLRGVYFVSGTQEGTPIDRMLGSIARQYQLERAVLAPQQASGRSYFLSRLLTEVVFAEQGLAGTNIGWERKRQAMVIAAYAGIGVLSIGTLVAWSISYGNNKRYVEQVSARVDQVKRQVQETPNRASSNLSPIVNALEATRGLAVAGTGLGEGDVPWSWGFGLYQGKRLDSAARAVYDRMLIDAMLPRLAIRVEEQLRSGASQQESQYEALKAYLMMYDPDHFDAKALKAHVESDWDARLGRELSTEQREQLSRHLDALLVQGAAVSPLPQDKGLIDTTRLQLASVSLPQRVYNRLRTQGLGAEFPEFTVVKAGGGNAPLVFTRVSGQPLTKGVPGLFSYNGYHKGFQSVVGDVAKQLDDEQEWVLAIKNPTPKSAGALLSDKLVDDVRRIYLNEYASTWTDFIADVRLVPVTSISQSVQTTRLLAAPDSPMIPLLKAMSRETTLLTGFGSLESAADSARASVTSKILSKIGARPSTTGAPEARIESIVDDRFVGLRRLVTAPEGGKAPIEGVVARLGELQVLLTSVEAALKGGAAPPASPLPNQLKAEAANAPEPVRSMLENLGSASSKVALIQLRESLARDVRSQIGEFCQQAVAGRYPFDPGSTRDVTQADFATLFGPGGKFDLLLQQKLAPYVDTSTRPWSFRPVDGTPLGTDHGQLPQFQRAAAIKETFFGPGGQAATLRLEFKPVEMDPAMTQFVLDVDGQVVRYAHGPQIPTVVQWPGPRGSGQVRVMGTPSGGMVNDGPWALLRLFDRVTIQPGSAPEKFRATFDLDGRKAVFDVTTSSVRNPFRMPDLRQFGCPTGL
ncbi:type VI secretion system membrane subunit TssM [Aquabacterium humicola]|uniref:type VI secretion system membrane subunit TssM n=1 Tax=Aquabacterium humicola TaxID=3237377 RepID=UPI002543C6F5|nr:type VI secretion system membrane subunit TssM [Rubrivivax pictus]